MKNVLLLMAALYGPFTLAAGPSAAEFVPVCKRTPAVIEALEDSLEKPCASMTASDLATLTYLKVGSYPTGEGDSGFIDYKPGDFSGLIHLTSMSVFNARSFPPGVLRGLSSLETMGIQTADFKVFQRGVLADVPKLTSLGLVDSLVEKFEPGAFADSVQLTDVMFESLMVDPLANGVLDPLVNLKQLLIGECGESLWGKSRDHTTPVHIPNGYFDRFKKLEVVGVCGTETLINTSRAAFAGRFQIVGLPPTFDVETSENAWNGL